MSSSNSPCAACKFLRRKCTQECVFAPYFPADQPQRFANVHKVFGASNVAKILNELESRQREDAVNSLAYEAEARLRDPVYGCVGVISFLQQTLKQLHVNLDLAKKELASMVGPAAMMQMLHSPNSYLAASPAASMMPYNINMMVPGPGPLDQLMIRDAQAQVLQVQVQQQQHNQAIDAQQLAAMQVREEQEIMRSFEQQQQQLLRYEAGDGRGGEPRQQPLLALGTGFGGNPYPTQQQQQQSDSEAVHRTMALQFHEQGAAGSANEECRGQPC